MKELALALYAEGTTDDVFLTSDNSANIKTDISSIWAKPRAGSAGTTDQTLT